MSKNSGIGTRKLYHILNNKLRELKVGRDKFFGILKSNHLLIKPKRSYHVTTWSHHRFRKHPNLIQELDITKPEQVWVSDITYIGKRDKPCYLSLITDAYSKKIMGYNVSDSLSTQGCINALKMAHKNRLFKADSLIHHSDRGIQYCSDEYQYIIKKYNLKCSMTQNSDPYENAVAERINGILKQEFMIDTYHLELSLMKKLVTEVINKYNQIRPHWSNHMLTPCLMHLQNTIKMKTYKTKNRSNYKDTSV
ncbi:integrase [Neptunitalea chrysea]|uniref:Integrase n=1 Tax=Neptunitalea chrysea TaxID=1647581 RepID=A0A9W6B9R0_9FLAO|nr:IS3 family transposase [Neptunitalea chrysea]GLB54208.1 integrase [Neptunitalea chrysea]